MVRGILSSWGHMAKEPSVEIAPQAPAQQEVPPLCYLSPEPPAATGPLPPANALLLRQESLAPSPTDQLYNDCNSLMWATIFGQAAYQYMALATGGPGVNPSRPDLKQVNAALAALRAAVSKLKEWLNRFKDEPLQKLRGLLGPSTDVTKAVNANWLGWKKATTDELDRMVAKGEIKIDSAEQSELKGLIENVGEKGVSYWSAKGGLQAQTQGTAKQREARARNAAGQQFEKTKADLPAEAPLRQEGLRIREPGIPPSPGRSEITKQQNKISKLGERLDVEIGREKLSPDQKQLRLLELQREEIELQIMKVNQTPALQGEIAKMEEAIRRQVPNLQKLRRELETLRTIPAGPLRDQRMSNKEAQVGTLETKIRKHQEELEASRATLREWMAIKDPTQAKIIKKQEIAAQQQKVRAADKAAFDQKLAEIKARQEQRQAEALADRLQEISKPKPPTEQ